MIQYQLKLRLTAIQKTKCEAWLPILGAVWNFAIRKIELNARNSIYFSPHVFMNLLAGHGERLDIPSHTLRGVLATAYTSWQRCFTGLSRRPHLKGARRPLNSIPFPDPIAAPMGGKIQLPFLGKIRFHKQWIPEGKIKCGRICKRASGWYLCLFIDAQPKPIRRIAQAHVGIDPGFRNLLTLSTGQTIAHPREFEILENRLGQAQRSHDRHLVARLNERIKNQRKDRNHKLSRRIVSENVTIRFSKDNLRGMSKQFGKSVGSSGHAQLRQQLRYKSLIGGSAYDEPDGRNSTMTCSVCGSLTGPRGWAGLSVRQWRCTDCGSLHDRDINAARNTLFAGAGCAHERYTRYA